jgi:hypothetical protein
LDSARRGGLNGREAKKKLTAATQPQLLTPRALLSRKFSSQEKLLTPGTSAFIKDA